MINSTRIISLIVIAILTSFSSFAKELNVDNKIGEAVISYEKTLNNNDIEGLLQLFTNDGAIVIQGSPTSIGTENIRKIYKSLFNSLDFDLSFHIDEIVQMSSKWAFVRTTTSGKVKILSNNTENIWNGHELFILKKQTDGNWKIARYAGSSAK